jgi:hemerythrin
MIEWSEALAIGIEEIDSEHKEAIKRICKLLAALDDESKKKELREIFIFLEEYIYKHFHDEEKYMEGFYFPNLAEHKKIHDAFRRDFMEFKQDLDTIDTDMKLVGEFKRVLNNWMSTHIMKMDMQIACYVRERFPFIK